MTRPCHRRSGAVTVEAAVVLGVLVVVMLGTMVCGVGVFRHQQVACLATEAARYASLRGGDYQKDTTGALRPPPTRQQIVDAAVAPKAIGMDPAAVSVTVQWIDRGANGGPKDWDVATKDVRSVTVGGEYVTNTVRVTATYHWTPGVFFAPADLTAVCELPMAY